MKKSTINKIVLSLVGTVVLAVLAYILWFSPINPEDRSPRWGVSEGITLSNPLRTAISDYYDKHTKFPKVLDELGMVNFNTSNDFVRSFELTADGGFQIFYQAPAYISGKSLIFSPIISDQGKLKWHCSSQDLREQNLPAACK